MMMLRSRLAVGAAGVLIATLGAGAPPAAAVGAAPTGTVSVPVGSWTATVQVPDVQWTSHGCQDVPMTITITGVGIDHWSVDANARLRGSGTSTGAYAYGDAAGTFTDEGFYMCPWADPSGVYDVTGVVEITDYDLPGTGEYTAPFTTSFTLSPMPTSTSLDAMMSVGVSWMDFTGRVVAQSAALGEIGADDDGQVDIEALQGGAWSSVGTGWITDQLGHFEVTVWQLLPVGTQFRATYAGATTSSPSSSVQWTIADWRPKPTVKVKAVSKKSKLKVDVNPNKGKGYWRFQVQKQQPDGSWTALKTYRTKGKKETRTINLKRGTYRVVVQPKYGFGPATSTAVYLKR